MNFFVSITHRLLFLSPSRTEQRAPRRDEAIHKICVKSDKRHFSRDGFLQITNLIFWHPQLSNGSKPMGWRGSQWALLRRAWAERQALVTSVSTAFIGRHGKQCIKILLWIMWAWVGFGFYFFVVRQNETRLDVNIIENIIIVLLLNVFPLNDFVVML